MKFPNLDPSLNLKSRIDLIDFDYTKQLMVYAKDPKHPKHKESKEALEFLNQYVAENVNAYFKKGQKRLNSKKQYEKDAYDRNNARNRCIYTKSKSYGNLDFIEDLLSVGNDPYSEDFEDTVIRKIDKENEQSLFDKELNRLHDTSNDADDDC